MLDERSEELRNCPGCEQDLPVSDFRARNAKCEDCRRQERRVVADAARPDLQRQRREYRAENRELHLLYAARKRAKDKGLAFDIGFSDVQIPERCPLLGLMLRFNQGRVADDSPTLDRINSDRGYVKGNVWVISARANRIKNDATVEELQAIADGIRLRISS